MIIADNSKAPNSRWYSGSGIYRPVWPMWVRGRHSAGGVKVTVVDRTRCAWTWSREEKKPGRRCWWTFWTRTVRLWPPPGAVIRRYRFPDAKLWDADHPCLYRCRARIRREGKLWDESSVSFGLRQIAWGSEDSR